VAAWSGSLASGLSRSAVAADFLTSAEAEGRAVADDYVTILGRVGSSSEVGARSSLLQGGRWTLDTVAEAFFDSAEFAGRAAKSVS
jgi:hypothetical protein